jgi:flagellar protein FliO/FliZ
MREMLEPVFGPNGAVVAQFVITLVVVLVLVAVVLWLVRRYGGNRFGNTPRSRAPRLAVIDTVPVDQRRRLVLVRRDNVEHLLLIGGPTDVVVEPAIRRAAQRPQPGQAARPGEAPAAALPRNDLNGGSEPVPFHPQGAEPAHEEPRVEVPPPLPRRAPPPVPQQQPAPSAHFAETARPTRVESVFSLSNALDEILDEPAVNSAAAFEPPGRRPAPIDRAAIPPEGEEALPDYLSLPEERAPATAAEDIDERPGAGDTATKVSDLEREMARLLGEITAKRGN